MKNQHYIRQQLALACIGLAGLGVFLTNGYASGSDDQSPTSKYYQLHSVIRLKSSNTFWDHIDYEQQRHLAFLSRVADGVTIVDVKRHKTVKQLENSVGSMSVVFAPPAGLGYTSNGDGSTTVFRLCDLKTVARLQIATNFDANTYDPVTGLVLFVQPNDGLLRLVNSYTGVSEGTIPLGSNTPDRAVPDGHGNVYIALEDEDTILKIDLRTKVVVNRWKLPASAATPAELAYDPVTNRLFAGCRVHNVAAVLAVLDGSSGQIVASLPNGEGNDDVVFDQETKRIYASNGINANVTIFQQQGPDTYLMIEEFETRPGARTMRLDTETKKIYTVTAEGLQDPTHFLTRQFGFFNATDFIPDSFVLLTYATGTVDRDDDRRGQDVELVK